MKTNYINSLVTFFAIMLLTASMTGCSKTASTASTVSPGNLITGVAASGAPISNGKVEIKGSNGKTAEATTNADGSYEANVTLLSEPYLVRVIAPSGEKYISVASKSDLVEGKKINITPLTHTIVAKVFQNADADNLFANFEAKSADFSKEKLKEEKDELLKKFIDAGLVGSGKVAGADIDLLNGDLHAGTSVGVDGLLDVIDVNTSATAGVEIKLKGDTTPIFTNRVDGVADVPVNPIAPAKLVAAAAQLDVIGLIRIRLNALAALHSSKVVCKGVRVIGDAGNPCDIDNLYAAFLPFFHTAYKDMGGSRNDALYGWFCNKKNGNQVKNKTECELSDSVVSFEKVYLKDITIISFEAGVVVVGLNVYTDGILDSSDEMVLKEEVIGDGVYKLLGNNKSFDYWISTESVFNTQFDKSVTTPDYQGVNSYKLNLNFYYQGPGSNTFVGDEVFSLTTASGHLIFPGNSATMSLYLVKGPRYENAGACSEGLTFSTSPNPYKVYNPSTGATTYANFATACATTNLACDCQSGSGHAYFDYDAAQKVTLSETALTSMDKVEKISIAISSGVAVVPVQSFNINKPLLINQFNAAQYIPSFGMSVASFCRDLTLTSPLNLSVQTGKLNYINLHHNYQLADNTWANQNDSKQYQNVKLMTAIYTPAFTGILGTETIKQSYLHLNSNDEYNRQFIRQVSCN